MTSFLWRLRLRLALWLVGTHPLVVNVIIYGFAAGRDRRPVAKHNTQIVMPITRKD